MRALDLLKRGICIDLDWVTISGKNIGYRLWVDRNDNVVFTNFDTGINEDVIPITNEDEILAKMAEYEKAGYGK